MTTASCLRAAGLVFSATHLPLAEELRSARIATQVENIGMKEHNGDVHTRFPWGGREPSIPVPSAVPVVLSDGAWAAVSLIDRPPLVYVVDDDDALRDSLRWLLESAGYRAETYGTAEHFLQEYDPGSAVCLILDVRLPGMSGLDLQQELNRRGEPLPIIFISGHGGVPIAVEAMKSGACHFLEKPFQDAQLLSLIDRAMAHGGSPDAMIQKP
jgi:CheY-like chemotaxis protein